MGLEEANIIIEKKRREAPETGGSGKEQDLENGTGKLDIGWLNTRSAKVGRDNEAELWAKARKFLENVNGELESNGGPDREKTARF